MSKILQYLFFIVALIAWLSGCSGGCSSDKNQQKRSISVENEPLVMIVKQRSDSTSLNITSQLSRAFEYAKIPYQTYDTELLSDSLRIPSSVRLFCITTTEVESFSERQFEQLLDFVAAGNSIFITGTVFDDRFNFLTGIKKDAPYKLSQRAEGFRFNELVFPGYENGSLKLRAPFYHNGLTGDVFKEDVEIVAHSFDSTKTPVITRNNISGGEVIMFNSGIAYDKLYRGLLFSISVSALDNVAYPVANVSTIFLDDFPLPLYDEKSPPIDSEYDMTKANYIAKIWWPDMQALADSFAIDYTAVQAFNYNANVVPPFDFNEWEASELTIDNKRVKGSVWLAKEVAKSRHELGLHGYNHFSLWLQDWPNQEFMISALKAARKRWRIDGLGPLPVTYVPPTNEIDTTGIVALSKAMPQIQNFSSLYLGELKTGGGREFGPDPYNPDLFDYPRISSGFIIDEENEFSIQGLFLLSGIWTHFVHPDDVFQVKQRIEDVFASRNPLGLGWHESKEHDYGLYEVFKDYLVKIKQTYPLINYKTVDDAVPIVKDWRALQISRRSKDSLIYATKHLNKNQLSTWFTYVKSNNRDSVEKYIQRQTQEYHFTPFWDGFLVQFNSRQDSLVLPRAGTEPNVYETPEDIHKEYLSFVSDEEAYDERSEAIWQDTRLRDARTALRKSPSSRRLQERLIDLAVEFNRVPLAIGILEDRLLEQDTWRTDDIERLLTYYGWEDASGRAYNFLEKLWVKHHDQSIITFKELMTERYGIPDDAFRQKWLERELALNPDNERILQRLVTENESQEGWPRTKEYLQRLIKQNPESDSLYFYSLQRSFYYESPEETISMLEGFPADATAQLQPLAAEVANLYAYTVQDYGKALIWAARAPGYPVRTKLEWLLQQKRYKAFIEQADQALETSPGDDSLRVFVGQQLIYEGFYDKGYARLYPLFKQSRAPAATSKLVHTEIGYQPYEQKKDFYGRYPAFFSDSLEQALQHQYRTQEGVKIGLTANYASDNFNNTIGRAGSFIEWGNRQKGTHRVTAEEVFAGSNVDSVGARDNLFKAEYQYQYVWPEKGFQLSGAGGFYYENSRLRPYFKTGGGYARDSTFTSAELTLQPVFTASAIDSNINELSLTAYREDFWLKGSLQTTLSVAGKRYSNEVYSYESLGRLYIQLPFSTDSHRIRSIAELSFSDASVSYTSGVPYYTPDKLFVKGLGAQYRYRDLLENPNLSFELEIMGKQSSTDGVFITGSARLNARLHKYWQLSLNGDISSSSVYRYNSIGFTVSYLLPKYLKPGVR